MFDKLKKMLSPNRSLPVQQYAATANDTLYATPRDFMKIILNEHGIKGQVGMCFINSDSIALLVRSHEYLPYEATLALEEKVRTRIRKVGNCQVPQEVFWAFVDQDAVATQSKA